MNARQFLNQTVERVLGEDIRLVGNWQPIPHLEKYLPELSAELGIPERELSRCRDIVDVMSRITDLRVTDRSDIPTLNFRES